ncbi:MAG: hypothetical protein R3240_13260, partial [Gammaproteobacteria bacterium]|nr:hypothetical protein [Gammaproteobacteria bacterium]
MGLRDRLLGAKQAKSEIEELIDDDSFSTDEQETLEIVNFSVEEEEQEDGDYLTEHEKKYREEILR